MLKKFLLCLTLVTMLFALLSYTALADTTDADIARCFTSPNGDIYCSLSADTLRSLPGGKGYMFGETVGKMKAYVIFVDWDDCPGAPRYTTSQTVYLPEYPTSRGFNRQNVWTSTSGGQTCTFDYSNPRTYFNSVFYGRDANGLKFNPGVIEYYDQASGGKMEMEVVCLNELAAKDTATPDVWPWFRLGPKIIPWECQFSNGIEDYRGFGRLHQGAIDIAYEYIKDLDLSDIGFLYTGTPINCYGTRQGNGGYGISTSTSYQDQWPLFERFDVDFDTTVSTYAPKGLERPSLKDPYVVTHEGAAVGSAVNISKNVRDYGTAGFQDYCTICHETGHGLGFIDDYHYDNPYTESSGATTINLFGIMGSSMTNNAPDHKIWNKFKSGWLDDDQVVTVLPGETKTIKVVASGSSGVEGAKMVLIPTEIRTLDTFHTLRNMSSATSIFDYMGRDYLRYFIPVWLGGPEFGEKTLPTGYTLDCRRAVGADYKNTSATNGSKGILINQLMNLTWETGHGGGGIRDVVPSGLSGNNICIGRSPYSNVSTWTDATRGITVTVLESGADYDLVQVAYNKNTKPYAGRLKINNAETAKVCSGQTFNLPIDLKTIGDYPLNNRGITAATVDPPGIDTSAVGQNKTVLGVPKGIVSYSFYLNYDPDILEFIMPAKSDDIAGAGGVFKVNAVNKIEDGKLFIAAANEDMVEDNILNLQFKPKTTIPYGFTLTDLALTINNLGLLDYKGNSVPIPGVNVSIKGGKVDIWHALMGDVNGDGQITPEDAMLVLQHYVGLITLDPRQVATALVSGNAELSPLDAALILRMVVGG